MRNNSKQNIKVVSENEQKMVEEIISPFKPGILKWTLSLFIILPLIYVLIKEKPGAWLPEQTTSLTDTSNEKVNQNVVAVSPFASLDSLIIKASNEPSFENYFSLSFEFYKNKKYKEAITSAERALEFKPRSAEAYNNICSSYNELKEYKKAIEACNKALEIDQDLQIAKNNLKWAEEQLKKN